MSSHVGTIKTVLHHITVMRLMVIARRNVTLEMLYHALLIHFAWVMEDAQNAHLMVTVH